MDLQKFLCSVKYKYYIGGRKIMARTYTDEFKRDALRYLEEHPDMEYLSSCQLLRYSI